MVPKKKEEGSMVSFYQRMGNNARWWSKKETTATLCMKTEHIVPINRTSNSSACPISEDEFAIYQVPGVDYAALFDRIGSSLTIWVISMVADVFVIWYHVRNRPHPKFMMTARRTVTITIHAIAGAGECMAGIWVAFLVGDQRSAMILYMSFFSICHIVTAVLQHDIVFGAKKVMIPCYLCAILMKAFCWYKLVTHMYGRSEEILVLSWFLSLELIHHIYVWVRVTIYFTSKMRLFRSSQYTISILMAGQVCVYPALGAAGIVFFWAFLICFQPLWKCCIRSPRHRLFYEAELDRNPFFSGLYRDRAVMVLKKMATLKQFDNSITFRKELDKRSKNELISAAFDILDLDDSGVFTVSEIELMLVNWGCPASDARKAMAQLGLGPEKQIDNELFKKHFYDVWHFCLVCLKEFASHLDYRMKNYDGSLIPFETADGNTMLKDSIAVLASRTSSTKISPY